MLDLKEIRDMEKMITTKQLNFFKRLYKGTFGFPVTDHYTEEQLNRLTCMQGCEVIGLVKMIKYDQRYHNTFALADEYINKVANILDSVK